MEAATTQQRAIEGEKAQRIVDAMRASVARRGVAGSTFDHVAREARRLARAAALLLRHEGAAARRGRAPRLRPAHGRARRRASPTRATPTDFIDALVALARGRCVDDDPEFVTLVFELFTLARRNDEIAAEFAELLPPHARARRRPARAPSRPRASLRLRAEPEAVADVLFALGDGCACACSPSPTATSPRRSRRACSRVRALLD